MVHWLSEGVLHEVRIETHHPMELQGMVSTSTRKEVEMALLGAL